jgi:Glyoxalase/Bleomycin resistance protein/Dioxygenase superfamily
MKPFEPGAAAIGLPDARSWPDLCHLGYVVKSMDRGLKSWQRGGAEIVIPPTFDPVQNVDCALLVAYGAVPVELVAPVATGPNPVEQRLKRGGGLDHVCLFVDGIEAAIEHHREAGAQLVTGPVYGVVWDRMIAFLVHRSGLVVELMERAPEGRKADPLAGG